MQLVALNWQKCDQGMMLNEGMFAGEGGYVRKPRGFRPGDTDADKQLRTLDLVIEVLAAAALPMPEDDDTAKGFKPYVKIELHSEDAPGPKGKTKNRRGIECSWGGERVEFKGVPGVVDQLAFVRWVSFTPLVPVTPPHPPHPRNTGGVLMGVGSRCTIKNLAAMISRRGRVSASTVCSRATGSSHCLITKAAGRTVDIYSSRSPRGCINLSSPGRRGSFFRYQNKVWKKSFE